MSNTDKTAKLANLLEDFVVGRCDLTQAQSRAQSEFTQVTAEEVAQAEQELSRRGIDDDTVYAHIESFLSIFQGILKTPELTGEDWHPIRTYQRENEAVEAVIRQAKALRQAKFVPNQWTEVTERLAQYEAHLSRKQNQLYPAFERQGFDRPTKIMWTLDDKVRAALRAVARLADGADEQAFFAQYDAGVALLSELIEKENAVLFPAAMEMIPKQEFISMRNGDDEIGYCLIAPPPRAPGSEAQPSFTDELCALLDKYGMGGQTGPLDVRQGKLTIEQINLIFRHLPVDISFVDEHELVRFYSDTKHRIFPRSPGVIGRDVKQCHPRKSVQTVTKIIEAFRAGQRDSAEFWLELGGKFLYILYTAVRDDDGTFRGVLELMQDATHIRSLQGTRRLLHWDEAGDGRKAAIAQDVPSRYGFTPDMTIGEVVKRYPAVRSWLASLSPSYKKLTNPVAFKAMGSIATLDMVAQRGGLSAGQLIGKLDEWVASQENKGEK